VFHNWLASHYLAKLAQICEYHYILHTYPRWCMILNLSPIFHISCYPLIFIAKPTYVGVANHFLTWRRKILSSNSTSKRYQPSRSTQDLLRYFVPLQWHICRWRELRGARAGPAIPRRDQEDSQWTIRRINTRCPREGLECFGTSDRWHDNDSTSNSV
jgi:hypothetical protein